MTPREHCDQRINIFCLDDDAPLHLLVHELFGSLNDHCEDHREKTLEKDVEKVLEKVPEEVPEEEPCGGCFCEEGCCGECRCCEEDVEDDECFESERFFEVHMMPPVHKIYFNKKHTTIEWIDGEKTTVGCAEGQQFDEYAGFCAAVLKRLFGSTREAVRFMNEHKEVQVEKPKKTKANPKEKVKKDA